MEKLCIVEPNVCEFGQIEYGLACFLSPHRKATPHKLLYWQKCLVLQYSICNKPNGVQTVLKSDISFLQNHIFICLACHNLKKWFSQSDQTFHSQKVSQIILFGEKNLPWSRFYKKNIIPEFL